MRAHDLFLRTADPEDATILARGMRTALWLPSMLFRAGAAGRNRAYEYGFFRSRRLPVPVISVGAITAGGAGKTPVTRSVVRLLATGGRKPAILSRGYGRRGSDPAVVDPGQPWDRFGDEPYLLACSLPDIPVIVGADRFTTGRMAINGYGASVLILDDGFQHRKLRRDLDLVVMDAVYPQGNGRFLPAGTLREPLSTLRRADAVILTRMDQTGRPEKARAMVYGVNPDIPIIETVYRPSALRRPYDGVSMPVDMLNGRRVLTVSGVANPASFERTVQQIGAHGAGTLRHADHHPFTDGDLMEMEQRMKDTGAEWIVTTEKDAARLSGRAMPGLLVLEIDLEIVSGDKEWHALILSCGQSENG